jgi:hypothetical protein
MKKSRGFPNEEIRPRFSATFALRSGEMFPGIVMDCIILMLIANHMGKYGKTIVNHS